MRRDLFGILMGFSSGFLRDFFGISKAKTELCATVSDSLSPGFFRRRGLYRSRIHSLLFGVAASRSDWT
jgi:hypothetical protein